MEDEDNFGNANADSPTNFSNRDQITIASAPLMNVGEGAASTEAAMTGGGIEIEFGKPNLKAQQISKGFSGGGTFENQEQKDWYDEQIQQRLSAGMSPEQAIQDYRNTFKIGEEKFETKFTGDVGKTKVKQKPLSAGSSAMQAFNQGFDSSIELPKFTYNKKGSAKPGTADTFTAFDTRQARRKAIVEGRGGKQADIREARATKKEALFDATTREEKKAIRKKFRKAKRTAKKEQSKHVSAAMDKIKEQGIAQRKQMKNPRTSQTMSMPGSSNVSRFKPSANMTKLGADLKAGKNIFRS
jgi:hypothetical protein